MSRAFQCLSCLPMHLVSQYCTIFLAMPSRLLFEGFGVSSSASLWETERERLRVCFSCDGLSPGLKHHNNISFRFPYNTYTFHQDLCNQLGLAFFPSPHALEKYNR